MLFELGEWDNLNSRIGSREINEKEDFWGKEEEACTLGLMHIFHHTVGSIVSLGFDMTDF